MMGRRRATSFGAYDLAGASLGSLLLWFDATPARAAVALDELPIDPHVVSFALSGGLAMFAAAIVISYLRERAVWRRREAALSAELDDSRAQLDRAKNFLASEPQIFIAWKSPDAEPDIHSSSLVMTGAAAAPRRILNFDAWLAPKDAAELESAVERLRRSGESFRLALTGVAGRHFDADGRAVGGGVVLRIREVSGDRLELIGLRERDAAAQSELAGLRALLKALPAPFWIRDGAGELVFVNDAYAQAVEAKSPEDAIARKLELLDQSARGAAAQARLKNSVWSERVNAVVAGERHQLDVTQAAASGAAAAIAIDRREIETVRADLERQMQSHVRTLDQLPTAVASFDRARRLIYSNDAYAKLWQLDPNFLEQKPTDGQILDRLRAEQRVPVESDYKAWKERLFEAYQSPEPVHHTWHLPNGRIIDVVAHPNPKGGVTYLYDDATKAYDLETRVNALARMQSETLDTLHEGVAVFGSDGRLTFSNPAFASLWRLDPGDLSKRPRFEALAAKCCALHPDEETWTELQGFVTGLNEMREGFTRRIERTDGVVLDCAAQPLLDGAALLTFVDVSADVSVERALTDRNKALLAAEKLRNDFIHHVSYELRSPLNNINGFVHLLGESSTGPLTPRQREYLGYVSKSSAALLAIVDDILDLATIDEDAMELEFSDVDVETTMRAAIEGVQDRLVENSIDVQIVPLDDVGTFRGDAKRVRQILFNLLSNAIGFSRPGQTVTLAAMRRENEIVFKVTDRGRGMSPEILERVFDRFESHTTGSRHRGVGLGLSIVRAFMELHGGKVFIDSAPGEGTTVTCIFPAHAAHEKARLAAARAGAAE